MVENLSLKRLREDRQRIVDLTQTAIAADLERAEQFCRETMRALERTGALSSVFSGGETVAQTLEQMKPMQAFYESGGLSRRISQAAFAARSALPAAFDSSTWPSTGVTQLFGRDSQQQFAGLRFSQSLVSEQLKMISGALAGVDFGRQFAEQLREPMRQLQELFDGYEEDERRVLNAIVPLGWLISPSMGMHTIRRLAAELDATAVEEIDDALIRYFNPEKCAEIVRGLYNDPAFVELQPLIDEGLAVHTEGHYRVAILAWLAAIDGVAGRKFHVRKLYGELKKKNGGKFRVAIEQTTRGREAFSEALIEILRRVSMTTEVDSHVPKRDVVMHGREIEFGNERASIQLLLVLEVMHFCELAGPEDFAIDAG